MPQFRIAEAAQMLGVSDDTVRRWLDAGLLPLTHSGSGHMAIDGAVLATFARNYAHPTTNPTRPVSHSVSNHFVGLVTNIVADAAMTQVEVQCGPHRVVSLMTTEAARELKLVPGSVAIAIVKSTQVIVQTPDNTTQGHG
jgi:molybdopterin-binding protein